MTIKMRTTIKLNSGDKARLQAIARQLGLTQGRGNTPNEGSVSGLMKAIAAGEVKVEKKSNVGAGQSITKGKE